MAYTLSIPLSLPATMTGLTDLRAQILDTAGATVGGAISATFVEIGSGLYAWTGTNAIPDNHRGCIYFYSNADPTAILAVAAINPEEAETVTTIATDVAGLDGDAMRGTDGAYTGTPPTAAAIADAVFDETAAGHTGLIPTILDASAFTGSFSAGVLVNAPAGLGYSGPGGVSTSIVAKLSNGTPVEGVDVWITTDLAGDDVIAGRLASDVNGRVTFELPGLVSPGRTFYVWRQLGGVNFPNPETIAVVAV